MIDWDFGVGVLSITPSLEQYYLILNLTREFPERGAEQALLNHLFVNWLPEDSDRKINSDWYYRAKLPLKYNLNLEAYRSWRTEWDQVWPDVRVVHYTVAKPNPFGFGGIDNDFQQPLEEWWKEWSEMVRHYGWTDIKSA